MSGDATRTTTAPTVAAPIGEEAAGPPPPQPPAAPVARVLHGALRVVGWIAIRVYPFALIIALWWLLSERGVFGNEFVMPPPDRVFDRGKVLVESGTLGDETWITLRRVLIAYGLAVGVGIVLGALIGRIEVVRQALRPIVSFLFPTPKVALYPAMFIVFGLGSASKIAFGFSEAVFPIVLATAAGTSQIEPRLLWSASALGTSPRAALFRVVIPAALPSILTGARIGLVGAIIGVFLGEMIAGADGLGHMMAVAYRTLETSDMYVAILTISIIGFLLDRTFLAARGRLLSWSAEGER
jgi:ABC-type nitrate/sulfonate/bicarbonate transport system permease component